MGIFLCNEWFLKQQQAESKPSVGFPGNRPVCNVTAMVRDLYQSLFLISGSGDTLCTFNSFCKNLELKKTQTNRKQTTKASFYFAEVKTILVPRTMWLCSAVMYIMLVYGRCTSASVAIFLYNIGPCYLNKSEKSFSSSAKGILIKRKKHLISRINNVRWEMFLWIQECNKRK